MRSIIPGFMLLAACSQSQEPATPIPTGTFAAEGRDRLCIAGEAGNYRAGLVIFGSGNVNCSASGRIAIEKGQIALVPRGEGSCRISLSLEGDTVRIAEVPAACSYYCGPRASMAGKSFSQVGASEAVADLAGDPLC